MHVFTRWDEEVTMEVTNAVLNRIASWHLTQIQGEEIAKDLGRLLGARDYRGLCEYEVRYESISVSDARHARQILAFYQKRQDLDFGVDRQQEALKKFMLTEALCHETNHIYQLKAREEFFFPLDVESVFFRAQQKIASMLGDVPSLTDLKVRFGPGATTQVRRKIASARRKLGQAFCCSKDMIPILREVEKEVPLLVPQGGFVAASTGPVIHRSKLSFVPKSATIDRIVCTEPSVNVMFQLGIGDLLVDRFRLSGLDLRDQGRNKSLAQFGSITNALATLDLSSASDTIATELVYDLLPIDWAIFLSCFRTGETTVRGRGNLELAKFSSMGNGYTFPVESLIFYALAWACQGGFEAQKCVSVFGDDIIVPSDSAPLLCRVLHSAGFIVNAKKSFVIGPFRESCGGDYLRGIDIRPFYQKGPLSCFDLFKLHNFYVRQGSDQEIISQVLAMISPAVRLWGPDGYGDGHLLGDNRGKPFGRERGWSGFIFDTYKFVSERDYTRTDGDRYLPSYSIYVGGLREGLPGIERNAWCWDDPLSKVLDKGLSGDYSDVSPSSFSYSRGRLGVPTPGTHGYKRISIYTF